MLQSRNIGLWGQSLQDMFRLPLFITLLLFSFSYFFIVIIIYFALSSGRFFKLHVNLKISAFVLVPLSPLDQFLCCACFHSQINENFAIDLVAEEPPIKVHARYVWCDGGGLNYFYYLNFLQALVDFINWSSGIREKDTTFCVIVVMMVKDVLGLISTPIKPIIKYIVQ